MTVNDLKEMVDALVKEGHGDEELMMDTDPDIEFDIEFLEFRDGYVGVRTNDNH